MYFLKTQRYNKKRSGFTLIEILLVLSLLALLAGIMAPIVLPSASSQLKHNTHLILSALRATRLFALQHRTTARLEFDTTQAVFRIPGQTKEKALVGDIQLQLTVAKQQITGQRTGDILFYPDGSSTGGRITLSHANLIQHIDVAWLTGDIKVYE